MSTVSRRVFVQSGATAGLALASARAVADEEARASEPRDPWLVMVYLAGDNDLTEDMVLALQDLLAEGPPRDDMILAQFDPSGIGLAAQRYDFSSVTPGQPLESYLDPDFHPSEINTGSGKALVDFVSWADGKCRQKEIANPGMEYRRLLILSGHGSGTTEDFLLKDESSLDSLTIDELEKALAAANQAIAGRRPGPPGKKIDILGLDACYMCMGEVAHQVRREVGILIGAEGLEPEFGWPYRRLLKRAKELRDKGQALAPEEVAKAIVTEYVEHYRDYDRSAGRSSDLAALDLAQMDDLRDRFKALVGELRGLDKAGHEKLLLAHWYAQTYKDDQFVDLKDLCTQVADKFGSESPIGQACRAVVAGLEGDVASGQKGCVLRSGCNGFACQYSYGVSIYFPWAVVSPDYSNLAFAEETGWREFLEAHVEVTRREPPRYAQERSLPRRWSRAADGRLVKEVAVRQKRVAELLGTARAAAARPETAREGAAGLRADERALAWRMEALQHVPVAPWSAPGEGEKRALAEKGLTPELVRKALGQVAEARLARAAARVAAADIADEDVPRELARRTLQAGPAGSRYSERTRYSPRTRYSERTRYSPRTRYRDEREGWVKNLPPAIGTDFWPKTERR